MNDKESQKLLKLSKEMAMEYGRAGRHVDIKVWWPFRDYVQELLKKYEK